MLVIFDCDGVLVDSEHLAAQIFSDVLLDHQIVMTPQECFNTFHGKTLAVCYAWVESHFNVALPSNFSNQLEAETRNRFNQELTPVDGVREVLDYLSDSGIKFCVASNGGHSKILNSLSKTDLLNYFPNRFSVDDVALGKPAPDLFLHAANAMGVSIDRSIVIEDSVSGWQAAKNAEIEVLMYEPNGQQTYENTQSFSKMNELLTIIKGRVAS